MKEKTNSKYDLVAPRSSPILMLNLLGIAIIFPLIFVLPDIISNIWKFELSAIISDILASSFFVVPGLLLIFFPNKYRIHFVIINTDNKLSLYKNRKLFAECDITKIKRIIFQEFLYPIPGFKQIVIKLEKVDESYGLILKEDLLIYPFGGMWKSFIRKLSKRAKIQLKIERLVENQNGKLIHDEEGKYRNKILFP
jgi:hypothetical protein